MPTPRIISWLLEWSCFLCITCQYAVRPEHISKHLRVQHAMTKAQQAEIEEEYSNKISRAKNHRTKRKAVPRVLDEPIPGLVLHRNGLLCQLDQVSCQYVCLKESTMREHLRTVHNFSSHQKKGRPKKAAQKQAENQVSWIQVACQQLFPSGSDSHFFIVRNLPGQLNANESVPSAEQLWEKHQLVVRSRGDIVVDNSTTRDFDPWIRQTGWLKYLLGLDRTMLHAFKEKPEPQKVFEVRVWEAVASIIKKGQAIIVRTSRFALIEIAKLEQDSQTQVPLQAYQEQSSLRKGVSIWQEIMTVLVRYLKAPDTIGRSLPFNSEQRARFETLLHQDLDNEDSSGDTSSSSDDVQDGPDTSPSSLESVVVQRCTKLERVVLACIRSLLKDIVRTHEYDCLLVCIIALIAGGSVTALPTVSEFPSVLSAIIKTSRFMILQSSYERQVATGILASNAGPSVDDIQTFASRYMRRGTNTPLAWIIDLRSYGMKLALTLSSDGNVSWIDDNTVTLGSIVLSISSLRNAIQRLSYDTDQLLRKQLLFGLTVPACNLSRVLDYKSSTTPGFSFLDFSGNGFRTTPDGQQRQRWLFSSVSRDRKLSKEFFYHTDVHQGLSNDSERPSLKIHTVRTYLEHVQQFLANLSVLCHLTSGQPARSTELFTIKHRNPYDIGKRNLFFENGLIAIQTLYGKGNSTISRPDVRMIWRFLPRTITEILFYYLWLVLPWIEFLETQNYSSTTLDDHLWPESLGDKQKFTVDQFRTNFASTMQEYTGSKIPIAAWRHLAIAIGRSLLPKNAQFIVASSTNEEDSASRIDDVFDLQAGHSSYVANLVYGREAGQITGDLANQHDQFRTISEHWHRLLYIGPQTSDIVGIATQSSIQPIQQQPLLGDTADQRLFRIKSTDIRLQLRMLYGPNASFRTKEQESLVQAVYNSEPVIIGILPTSGGKSLSFLLPAAHELAGTTVVVVPLVALIQDFVRRAKELSIVAAAWRSDFHTTSSSVKLLFIAPESVASASFFSYLQFLRTSQQLDRIVIDECHLFINGVASFRPAFTQLFHLYRVEIPLVFLTATLPYDQLPDFFKAISIPEFAVHTIRAGTSRPNLTYSVVLLESIEARLKKIEDFVRDFTESKLASDKMIIFCRRIETVQQLGDLLGCSIYHAQLQEKNEVLAGFRSGNTSSIIATTSALSLGVDITAVRCIVHFDTPDCLIDYVQESGRAGRDEKQSSCILFASDEGERIQSSDSWLVRYIYGEADYEPICRRQLLKEYLDGGPTQSCQQMYEDVSVDAEIVRCDICTAGQASKQMTRQQQKARTKRPLSTDEMIAWQTERARKLKFVSNEVAQVQSDTATMKRQVLAIVRSLDSVCARCSLSRVRNPDISYDHNTLQCQQNKAGRRGFLGTLQTIKRIKFAPYAACYFCGLPQELCGSFVRSEKGFARKPGVKCMYGKKFFEAAAAAIQQGALYTSLPGQLIEEEEAFIRRCGKKESWMDWEASILFRTVIEFWLGM